MNFKDLLMSKLKKIAQPAHHESVSSVALDSFESRVRKTFDFGKKCVERGKYSEALAHFDRVLEWDPDSAEAWVNKARIYELTRNPLEAIRCLHRAVDIKPYFPVALFRLSQLYDVQERYHEAAFWLKRAIDYGGSEAQSFRLLYEQTARLAHAQAEPPLTLFVSYPWRLKDQVGKTLLPHLHRASVDYFIDQERVPQTESMEQLPWQLELGVAQYSSFLYVLCRHTFESWWMKVELSCAIAMHKPISVVALDGTTPPPALSAMIDERRVAFFDRVENLSRSGLIEWHGAATERYRQSADYNRERHYEQATLFGVPFDFVRLKGGSLRDFELGVFPVTQLQWEAVTGRNPARYVGDLDRPVESVSWSDAMAYTEKLTEHDPKHRYKLPTGFEWEYACRAGGTGSWTFGSDEIRLAEHAWYFDNTRQGDSPGGVWAGGADFEVVDKPVWVETSPFATNAVHTKVPNLWGLYHMHGNAWEWCLDGTSDNWRMTRGGAYDSLPRRMRCSRHEYRHESERAPDIGLRICRTDREAEREPPWPADAIENPWLLAHA